MANEGNDVCSGIATGSSANRTPDLCGPPATSKNSRPTKLPENVHELWDCYLQRILCLQAL